MNSLSSKKSWSLDDPVDALPGVGSFLKEKLQNLGVEKIRDILTLLPHRLEDRSQVVPIKALKPNELVVITGTIESVHTRTSKRGVLIVQARIVDKSGKINALWFNQRYILRQLQPGMTVLLYGEKRIAPTLGNPFFVKTIITKPEITPIYPATEGLGQAAIRKIISLVADAATELPDILPEEVREMYQLVSKPTAIQNCHTPSSPSSLDEALKTLAFEELVLLALEIRSVKSERLAIKAEPISIDTGHLKQAASLLPFTLTDAQRRAAWEIIQDLAESHPMYRLLYGEVGSGKTAVALMAVAAVAREKRQVVWLNPTTILAAQHAENLKKLLATLHLKIALVTGSEKEKITDADVIIGTHALLQPNVQFNNPGLIVIDEQHRFGVAQRQLLVDKFPATHLLMMTATPIPRSLAQTLFGHLDLTYLTEKPKFQKPVRTVIFTEKTRNNIEKEIEAQLSQRHPGYVICPLINESGASKLDFLTTERKVVTKEEKRLKERFPTAAIAVVHGKIDAKEREKIIRDFKLGAVDILLSTTVVEVGIDNPNATWILIEEADRFGLSQLHQLRGRVGRGEHESVCYFAQSLDTPLVKRRLKVLEDTFDGLKIAEQDLAIRGPGELVGMEQSGLPPLKYANFENAEMIRDAFECAENILKKGLENFPELLQAVHKQMERHEHARG